MTLLTLLGLFVGAVTFTGCEIKHLSNRNKKVSEMVSVSRVKATKRISTANDTLYGVDSESSSDKSVINTF